MTDKPDFKTRVLDSPWTIIIGVAVFGPFALPLLWRNPKYGRGTKTFWTVITVIITLFCLWAMKYQVQLVSKAMSAEPCRLEQYRPAYPPGERAAKIFAGTESKKPVAKFSNTQEFFEFLKKSDGKICDVNWTEAKNMIENWMHPAQSAEDTVGPEIKALIEKQSGHPSAQVAALAPALVAEVQPQKTCESKLLQLRDRLSALKGKTYDSQQTRSAEIDSILRSFEPGPLK
jgi:hypothetical protein